MLAERIDREAWTLANVDWAAHERELDNVRTALAWLVACDDVERTGRLAANFPFLRLGHFAEQWGWCEHLLARLPETSKSTKMRILRCAAYLALYRGDQTTAGAWAQESLLLALELGDRKSEASALFLLSQIASDGDEAVYEDLVSAAATIYQELGAEIPLVGLMHDDGLRALRAGDRVRARASFEAALERARNLEARNEIGNTLCDLGVLALYERRFDDALRLFAESLPLVSESRWHFNVAFDLSGIACVLAAAGEASAAARLFGAAEALNEHLGEPVEDYAMRAFAEGSAPVRERLGEVELAEAWAAGRALDEADATAYALKTVTELPPL